MRHSADNRNPLDWTVDLLAVSVYENEWQNDAVLEAANKAFDGQLFALLENEKFAGKAGEARTVDTLGATHAKGIVVVGLGKKSDMTSTRLRDTTHLVVQQAAKRKSNSIGFAAVSCSGMDTEECLEHLMTGVELGTYRFDTYLSESKPVEIADVIWSVPADSIGGAETRARAMAAGVVLTRNLVNEPAGTCTPERMAEQAQELADTYGFSISVLSRKELKEKGCGGILGVSAGSAREAHLIHLIYRPNGTAKRRLALVGKGVTFDSGGYDMKQRGEMLGMKMDMAGAATVLGVFKVLGALRPNVEVHGFVPTCENLVNGEAYKPGDVLTAYGGKTIEIGNTDAEGRLLLADALGAACDEKPDAIFDMATLTGSTMIALGGYTAAVFSNDEELGEGFLAVAKERGESFWPLPLDTKLRKQLDSKIADIKNVGKRFGGAITAALFLKEFVGDTPWVHLDIAGPAYVDAELGSTPYGGTGFGVLTLAHYLGQQADD